MTHCIAQHATSAAQLSILSGKLANVGAMSHKAHKQTTSVRKDCSAHTVGVRIGSATAQWEFRDRVAHPQRQHTTGIWETTWRTTYQLVLTQLATTVQHCVPAADGVGLPQQRQLHALQLPHSIEHADLRRMHTN